MWIGKGNVSRVISQENHQFANINPFYTTGLFIYPLKTSENQNIERDQWYGMG